MRKVRADHRNRSAAGAANPRSTSPPVRASATVSVVSLSGPEYTSTVVFRGGVAPSRSDTQDAVALELGEAITRGTRPREPRWGGPTLSSAPRVPKSIAGKNTAGRLRRRGYEERHEMASISEHHDNEEDYDHSSEARLTGEEKVEQQDVHRDRHEDHDTQWGEPAR